MPSWRRVFKHEIILLPAKHLVSRTSCSVLTPQRWTFPWADYRQTKGAIKLHSLLDHDGYLPDFPMITDGKTSDVTAAHNFTLPAGSIVAVDRGYYDFDLFAQWDNSGVFFVARLKSNATYEIVKECPLLQHSNILTDQLIHFADYQSRWKFPGLLPRVVVLEEDNQREIELLTNYLCFGQSLSAESTGTAGKSSSSSKC